MRRPHWLPTLILLGVPTTLAQQAHYRYEFCNPTTGSITPSATTFNIRVIQ